MGSGEMRLYQSTEEIERLVHAFEDCTLPGDQWTHAAHLTVALWYLAHHPIDEATDHIRSSILAYNASRGVLSTPEGGYHETITLFYIRAVARYLSTADPILPLPTLFDGLMREYGHKQLLAQYYSRPLLRSTEARTAWVEPDLRPWD